MHIFTVRYMISYIKPSYTAQPTDPTQLLLWQKQNKHAYAIIYLLINPDEQHIITVVIIAKQPN